MELLRSILLLALVKLTYNIRIYRSASQTKILAVLAVFTNTIVFTASLSADLRG